MPTISQLPLATSVSAADEVLISQGGTARATLVGSLLASTQPAITADSQSLIGRTSLGPGSPEQVNIGIGINLAGGTLVADGLDHALFPVASSLFVASDLVISNQGSPMLMPASLLRGLFSAGTNVDIDSNGVISSSAIGTMPGIIANGSSIGQLPVVTALAAQDLVAVSHSGLDAAITYDNFLGGVTIDQAQVAGPAADSDTIWVAQGGNVMTSQTFGAIWAWIASRLPTYKVPIVEITADTQLDMAVHNGRILICSQPVRLSPLTDNLAGAFQCTVINASSGDVTLDTGFVSSSGSFLLASWQSSTLSCLTYSGGTIAFAAMPMAASANTVTTLPGQVTGLSEPSTTATAITISWEPPTTGGEVSFYIVLYRMTGVTSWSSTAPVVNATSYQITGLSAGTSYDVGVAAHNSAGPGAASAILTVATANVSPPSLPPQVNGVTATPTTSSTVQLGWSAEIGTNAATSHTVQYRATGSSGWTSSVTGMTGTGGIITGLQAATSYDFSVIGINSVGAGPASSTVTAVTPAAAASVDSITWNSVPSGTYMHGSGTTIGLNAQVSPANSPIQFGFSLSATTPPSSWTTALHVNSSLWGAYLPAPPNAGTWYAWAEGLDSTALTVYSMPFVVQ